MAGGGPTIGSYSPFTGFVFIFNLIVGAGALTIPHAFVQTGIFYGLIALAVLASTSYITATFMVEAIAGVNALKKRSRELDALENADGRRNDNDSATDIATPAATAKLISSENDQIKERAKSKNPNPKLEDSSSIDSEKDQRRRELQDHDSDDSECHSDEGDKEQHESLPLMVPKQKDDKLAKMLNKTNPTFDFDLARKVELAQMAHLLYGRKGLCAFYLTVVVYLYGDLAIYAVAVPKSLREIVCPRPSPSVDVWQCSENLNSYELYRFFVIVFAFLLGPFTFGHVQKTRLLQLATTLVRHASFGLMILLACVGIVQGQGRNVGDVMLYQQPEKITNFFGVCIYSFMCHHSVPGLIAPITKKSQVGKVIACSFLAVFCVYTVLCLSAAFRFSPEEIDDVYTLNFKDYSVRVIAYFLSLFPVCTLSASFPIICITLRENLRTLHSNYFTDHGNANGINAEDIQSARRRERHGVGGFLLRHCFALAALVPPVVVAFFTEDVSMLVGFTGAYAGLGIQWIVPTSLVYLLRRRLEKEKALVSGGKIQTKLPRNPYASPFSSPFWVYFTMGLSLVSVVVITISKGMHR